MTKRCEEYSMTRHGICDRPLDEHDNCDRASEHAEAKAAELNRRAGR